MTPDELKTALIAQGWKITKAGDYLGTGVEWYAWMPSAGRKSKHDCTSNHKPPAFVIRPTSILIGGDTLYSSVTFEVCGEVPSGHWLKFDLYSVKVDDTLKTIATAQKILTAAWDAAWESA